MTTNDTPSPAGRRFGPYELLRLLGKGGMGEVYAARDTRKGRVVAVKLMPGGFAQDPRFRQRFEREAHIAANLNDPHVVPIHDYGAIDETLYIEMAMVDGSDLRTLLTRNGPMPPAAAVDLIEQVGSAVDAAHAQGLVHRDIKPENVLITAKHFAYLSDFGIAAHEDDTRLTSKGNAVGSLAYMAPERFEDQPVTGAADIYALTCVLVECLTGGTPYRATSATAMLKQHLFADPPRVAGAMGLPPAVDAVIARGLAKEPGLRFASAAELGRAARSALAGQVDDRTAQVPATGVGTGDAGGRPTAGPEATTGFARMPTTDARAAGTDRSAGAGSGVGSGAGSSTAAGRSTAPGGKRRSRTPLIAAALAVVVAVVALGGYLVFGHGGSSNASGKSTSQSVGATPGGSGPASGTTDGSGSGPASGSTSGGSEQGTASGSDGGAQAPTTVTQTLADWKPRAATSRINLRIKRARDTATPLVWSFPIARAFRQ